MPTEYTVQQGDCVDSIAAAYGFLPQTIWYDAANADLKRARQSPNILQPGDRVLIPDRRVREISAPTERRHRFRVKGTSVSLRLQLHDEEGAIANECFVIRVNGTEHEGMTTGEGNVEVRVPAHATEAVLVIRNLEYPLRIGHLDPAEYASGIRGRLGNLGYTDNHTGDESEEELRQAIESFQESHALPKTGQADNTLISKLSDEHKC